MAKLVYICLLFASGAIAQVQIVTVRPQDADPSTSTGEPHLIAANAGPVRVPLVLFLPGSDASPAQYQILARTIAGWGLPVISLTYPNPLSVNVRCAISLDTSCFDDARTEVWLGESRSSLLAVGRADSIDFRLLRLLQYLHRTAPARGWDQFFSGDRVLWHRLVVSGHSQGGGIAGFLARKVRVARAVMFAGMDYFEILRRVAPWMEQAGATPPAAIFALGHERDELVSYSTLSQRAWPALGIDRFGEPLPFTSDTFGWVRSTHMDAVVGIGTAHSLVASDTVALLNASARQQLERAWRHLYQGAAAVAVNAASYQAASVAPGSIVSVYAAGIQAGRTYSLTVDGRAATVFATAAGQVNAVLPAFAAGVAHIELREGPQQVWTGVLETQAAAPGIFTRDFSGQGEAAVTWTGNIVSLYGTGWRGASGTRATLDGQPLEVLYSGAQPEFAGLDQMNLRVPAALSGRVGLELRVDAGGVPANIVRLTVPRF